VRGGAVVASIYRGNIIYLHRVTLDNGFDAFVDDNQLFFQSTSFVSSEGFVVEAQYRRGWSTSSSSSKNILVEEETTPVEEPTKRAIRAARRAANCPEPA
jgi:hypothetical protein